MAVNLQQRATEYGAWRNNAETERGHGRLKSSTCRLDYKWGDYHYNWHRQHGSLNHQTPISTLGLCSGNLMKLHS